MIHQIIPSVNYNLWLKRLNTQLNESTNQTEVYKVIIQRRRNWQYKTLGTSVINSPMFPMSFLKLWVLFKMKHLAEVRICGRERTPLFILWKGLMRDGYIDSMWTGTYIIRIALYGTKLEGCWSCMCTGLQIKLDLKFYI